MDSEKQRPARRNTVMIICDTLRPDFLNIYGADHIIPTPNIDALAEHGVVFENAITPATVCGPARASIVTGSQVSCHDGWTNEMPLRDSVEYFPRRLDQAGYITAAVGTLDHVRIENKPGYHYTRDAFHGREGLNCIDDIRKKHPEAERPYLFGDDKHFALDEDEHYDRWSCDRATDFIRYYAKNHSVPSDGRTDMPLPTPVEGEEYSPFFLVCGFLMPHGPQLPPKEMKGRIDINKIPPIMTTDRDEDIPAVEKNRRAFLNPHDALYNDEKILAERMQNRVLYCEMICEIDDLVGRIISALKETGLYDNTTIIFTSDHGSMEDDYNLSTKGPWPYSPQLFVPLVVSNPPKEIKQGQKSDTLCSSLDIGATVLSLAGDNKRFGVSRSLFGLITGEVPERTTVMSEFCDSCKTLVDKRFTFTYYPFTGKTALYDRIADKAMDHNLGGNPAYADVERKFLMDVIDHLCIAKGVRIEAHDLVPEVKRGIEEKDPKFLDNFDICYPLSSMTEVERLREAGLDPDINEFCKTRPIKAHYGAYFLKKDKKR